MKRTPQRPRGRPAKGERISVFVRLEKVFGQLVQTCKTRKGMDQAEYIQALITVGDKQIPNKPVIKFTARPIAKV